MANNKQKLELTWIGKDNPEYDIANIEPRILDENPELSNCANDPNTENMLIHGDNLLALKALLPEYEGKVKCIYIDPPYNTGNAFEHYDDSVEHSTWLSLMKPRLELLRMLLGEAGSIWVSLDDNEFAYLKVLMDEIFGRNNFLGDIIWNSTKSVTNTAIISTAHTHNLVYFKQKDYWIKNRSEFRLPEDGEGFANPDNDSRGPWKADPFQVGGWRPNQQYEIVNPKTGKVYKPNKDCSWKNEYNKFQELLNDGRIVFGKTGDGGPQRKRFLSEATERGKVATTLWTKIETTTNGTQHSKYLFGDDAFSNPKPEQLLQEILNLSSSEGDIILDSFLGSGTTAAVAHKLNRKYIGVELGEHAYTHCKVRLDKVIDGLDEGGISKAVNWKGGGAYKFYELAPSFIAQDEFGNPIIDTYYNDEKLIRAMCKLMNFTYQPSQTEYWKHGVGQGKNYLYITTQFLTSGMVQQIIGHLAEGESLIICPKKFEPGADKVDSRITIKKIPQSVLKACHFGKKEYLLPIKETAMEEVDLELDEENDEVAI